eukprot:2349641-Pleurochrysis_carterae.AAC.4
MRSARRVTIKRYSWFWSTCQVHSGSIRRASLGELRSLSCRETSGNIGDEDSYAHAPRVGAHMWQRPLGTGPLAKRAVPVPTRHGNMAFMQRVCMTTTVS